MSVASLFPRLSCVAYETLPARLKSHAIVPSSSSVHIHNISVLWYNVAIIQKYYKKSLRGWGQSLL